MDFNIVNYDVKSVAPLPSQELTPTTSKTVIILQSENGYRRITTADNGSVGRMIDKANQLLEKLSQNEPEAIMSACDAIENWNARSLAAYQKGNADKGNKIQKLLRNFQQNIDALDPSHNHKRLQNHLSQFTQQAADLCQMIERPDVPIESKAIGLNNAFSLLSDIKELGRGNLHQVKTLEFHDRKQDNIIDMDSSKPEFVVERRINRALAVNVEMRSRSLQKRLQEVSTYYHVDRMIHKVAEGVDDKLDLVVELISTLPDFIARGRTEVLRDILTRNPDLYLTRGDLIKRFVTNNILHPRDYVLALKNKEKKRLIKTMDVFCHSLSSSESDRSMNADAKLEVQELETPSHLTVRVPLDR